MKDIVRFVLYVKKKEKQCATSLHLPTVSPSSPCVASLHLLRHLYL